MLKKIPGNAEENSEECWQRFSRILKKIERLTKIESKDIYSSIIQDVRKSLSKHHV